MNGVERYDGGRVVNVLGVADDDFDVICSEKADIILKNSCRTRYLCSKFKNCVSRAIKQSSRAIFNHFTEMTPCEAINHLEFEEPITALTYIGF